MEEVPKSPTVTLITEEIQAKAEELKKGLKHVETQVKIVLPTAEDIVQAKKEEDKTDK